MAIVAAGAIVCGCTSKSNSGNVATVATADKVKTLQYSNDFFSLTYPATYEVEADFSYKVATMDELQNMSPEQMSDMGANEMYIVPRKYNQYWTEPEVYIVLSRYKLEFPIRMFMELSTHSKAQSEDESMEYIGNTDVDSTSFCGYPTLQTDFLYRAENGDTLINHQIIVQKPDYSLYYLNVNFNYNKNPDPQVGFDIINSIKFKD